MHSRPILLYGPRPVIKQYRRGIRAGLLVLTLLLSISCTQSDAPTPTTTAPVNSAAVKHQDNYIIASPNPVPAGPVSGKATIIWRTKGIPDTEVHVYVVSGDGKENLFAIGPEGSQDAPWILGDTEFRLYQVSGANKKLLDKVIVTRGEK